MVVWLDRRPYGFGSAWVAGGLSSAPTTTSTTMPIPILLTSDAPSPGSAWR